MNDKIGLGELYTVNDATVAQKGKTKLQLNGIQKQFLTNTLLFSS